MATLQEKVPEMKLSLTKLKGLLTTTLGDDNKHSPIWKEIQTLEKLLKDEPGPTKSAVVKDGYR